MFERYLTDALTKQFGHLVADLDSEKIRLSAWNGCLVLEDVVLRNDALDSFVEHCPLELAYGRIGRLELKVPWSLVGSMWRSRKTKSGDEEDQEENGVSIVVSDVNILLTPRRKAQEDSESMEETDNASETKNDDDDDDDDGDNKQKLRERKEKIVQTMLDAQLLSRVALSSQMTSRWNWVQDWISSLLSKLSVTARNIHIRYEDPGHCMGFMWNTTSQTTRKKRSYREAFAIGITLREFSVINSRGEKEKNNDESKSGLDTNTEAAEKIQDDDGDVDDVKDVEKHNNNVYVVKNTVASAAMLAIYWDSHGSTLMSERAAIRKPQHTARDYLKTAFAILNGDSLTDQEFSDKADFNASHTFLLDPVSPSVQFALVSDPAGMQSPSDENDSSSAPNKTTTSLSSAMPSSVKISLPPTLFSLSRHILEDIVYLRKSLDVWIHAKKGILSERTLKRLAALRPLDNACENPRGWWKYAAEATMAFVKAGRQLDPMNNGRSPETSRTRSGWIGLARALAARKRYVAVYKEFLVHDDDEEKSEMDDGVVFGPFLPPEQRREKAHETLLGLEDHLNPSEISAFRIAAYKEMVGSLDGEALGEVATPYRWKPLGNGATDIAASSAYLSANHRYQMFVEMAQALDTEMVNTEILNMEMRHQSERNAQSLIPGSIASVTSEPASDPVVWTIALSCTELALQVNDQPRTKIKSTYNIIDPIVRLSCACVLQSNLYVSGSWNADWSIAALVMEDLALAKDAMQEMKVLLGPKLNTGDQSETKNIEILCIDGVSFQENVRISLSRAVEWQLPGSTTHTRIRLSPLEIMYSTVPFEALSRVLATVKTPELTDDYHRMASRVFEWRQRQKQRFLEALAHKGKKILIDVDMTAPVLLIPEIIDRTDSPLLVLDLGHLHFSNVEDRKEMNLNRDVGTPFDDAWRLSLTNIQVQCTTTRMYRHTQTNSDLSDAAAKGPQQVVEGFSLDVAIWTKVADAGVDTRIKVAATLPKLSFNITTSSVRLLSRLRSQWSQRKHEMTTSNVPKSQQSALVAESTMHDGLDDNDDPPSSKQNGSERIERQFEFCFSAPLIAVKLENDVDSRLKLDERASVLAEHASTPIVSVTVRGIGGTLIHVMESGRYSTKFNSKLGSVVAEDHYQSAGIGFQHLLSCLDPSQVPRISPVISNGACNAEERAGILPTEKDLVLVEFTSEGADNPIPEDVIADKLSVQFHELYVEWNPETIAAIHKALRTPKYEPETAVEDRDENVHFDEFFDAEESTTLDGGVVDGEVFFDTLDPSFADLKTPLARLNRRSTLSLLSSQESTWKLAPVALEMDPVQNNSSQASPKPFMVVFNLSKLRVSFNKESRHRRLFAAEMDRTSVTYEKHVSGRSITKAKLGNLIISDPSADDNQTLYGQILGLQNAETSDAAAQQLSSLLEMELVSVPRSRQIVGKRPEGLDEEATSHGVSLCYNDGSVQGYDTHVRARLSPMRFVYLSQLYSEIIDYFFEGIVGYEVLGGDRPAKSSSTQVEEKGRKDDNDPEAVSFTAVDVVIDSPQVLFPVTYRSPHFMKLQTAGIKLSNCFECKARANDVARWHNNYNISFESIRISSWDGSELSHSRFEQVGAAISLRWPIGPLASLENPKWNVTCKIDSLVFSLRRDDYALLQDIVSHNIGEDSRNLDEWNALQNLNSDELERYKQSIMVHYGYDTKDVAPTTYTMSLSIPLVSVQFERGGKNVGVAECSSFSYQMKKLADCVSCQTIKSCIKLVHPTEHGKDDDLLISSKGLNDFESLPELTYMSKTDANGNNVKSLEIKDACIYMVYPAWTTLADFFSDLPTAEVLTAEEVGLSIQIGDRWYKISGSLAIEKESVVDTPPRQFSWIGKENQNPAVPNKAKKETGDGPSMASTSFQFRVLLSSPHIIISSSPTEAQTVSLVLRLRHLDFLHKHDGAANTLNKSLFLHDLELYTSSRVNGHDSLSLPNESSLIHPWCLSATQSSCSKQFCDCSSHSIKIAADVLKARVSFSDMVIVVEVCLRFLADKRHRKLEASTPVLTSKKSDDTVGNGIDLNGSELSNGEPGTGTPPYQVMTLDMDGFELLLVDDSGRQFVTSQELITLKVGRILLCREENALPFSELERSDPPKKERKSRRMTLCLQGLDLLDCLQPDQSPFRLLATTRWGSFEGQGDNAKTVQSRPKMQWELFTVQNAVSWGFFVSQSLIERTNPGCFANLSDGPEVPHDLDTLTLRSFEDGMNLRTYSVTVRALMMQYNPSTVIALQRFMGRFRKHAVKSLQLFNEEIDNLMQASAGADVDEPVKLSKEVVKVDIELQRLAVCLNKEHLNRRLLRVVLGYCTATMLRNDEGMTLEGGIRDVSAWDCDPRVQTASDASQNMCVLRTSSSDAEVATHNESKSPPFLKYRYCTFSGIGIEKLANIPVWLHSHVAGRNETVDDFLEVEIGTIETTYLRERTEEIVDYLSNGLPGKGMGMTSKAAQDFVKTRIRTKSFLHVGISSPVVIVPRDDLANSGLQLRLGDIDLKSWFEGGSSEGRIDDIDLLSGTVFLPGDDGYQSVAGQEQSHWWRMLSLQITSFTAGMFATAATSTVTDALNGPLDVSLFLQKSAWHNRKMSLRCHVSLVDMTLKYSQYCLLCAVVDGNVGKKIDKDKWDNIEKAYDLEIMEAEGHLSQSMQPRPVEYASGARHVRFGPKGALSPDRPRKKTSVEGREGLVDVKISLDGFTMKLHRDDPAQGAEDNGTALAYDMILLKVHLVEVSIDNNISEEFSFQLALYRIALFDLGDQGRLVRERLQMKDENRLERRQPCAFAVLVEGYESAEDDSLPQGLGSIKTKKEMEPQLMVTVDKVPASAVGRLGSMENQLSQEDGSSTVTLAKVVLNFLSVNALIRPFTELVSFLTLAWPSPSLRRKSETNGSVPVRNDSTDTETEDIEADSGPQKDKSSSSSRLQVKLVAHYPRIFFVADESDSHSRALVLRGLAVVNAGRIIKSSAGSPHSSSLGEDVKTDIVLDAQLHSLESYINPDVNSALRLQHRHTELLAGMASVLPLYEEVDADAMDTDQDELGVALLQPVTAGIEYGKISRSRFPSKRFFSVNIEPISTMVSFDDLQLIEAVFNRWAKGRKDSTAAELQPSHQRESKVGSQAANVVVAAQPSVYDVVFETKHLGLGLKEVEGRIIVDDVWDPDRKEIRKGDTLARIEGQQVQQLSLGNIVEQLASTPRPTRIAFVRPGTTVAVTPDVEPRAHVGVGVAEDVSEETTSQPKSIAEGNKFTLHFKCGIPNGLTLEESCVVCIPVITKVEPSITMAVLQDRDAGFGSTKRFPRTGALIVQLNGLAITESNHSDALAFIGMNGNRDGAVKPDMVQNDWYSLTFMEIESKNWGNIDAIDLSIQGAALTFIDDLNGKDMPLIRGTLKAVETHFRSGVGINTTLLDRVKELPHLTHSSFSSDIRSDSSTTLRTVARTTIEYFHARKALYEPLLEPAQLCYNYECHSGNEATGTPGQIALELSDTLMKSNKDSLEKEDDDGHMICVNVSDSSMEVLAKALREWKLWREMVQARTAVMEPDPALHVSQSGLSQAAAGNHSLGGDAIQTSKEAQKKEFEARAVQAAFLFAQKRGAKRSGKDESSKPFVFKNRTGVSIAFVQQNANDKQHDLGQRKKSLKQNPFVGDYVGLDKYDRCDVCEVADGEDAKFQMDFMSSSSKSNDLTKKIRTYDGKLPCIKVAIQSIAGVSTETLSDLQVQRAGSWIRNLSVYKAASTENRFVAQYSVPIVWKVEVEDNRRVLTLSSAVRVVSLNALVVEIGARRRHVVLEQKSRFGAHPHVDDGVVKEDKNGITKMQNGGQMGSEITDDTSTGDDESTDIQVVGVSLPDAPFYLPLWLAMRLEFVQIYVRPRFGLSSQYQWGHQSVLQFSSIHVQQTRSSNGIEWVWKDTIGEGVGSIKCEAKENGAPAAFLSCFTAGHVSKDPTEQLQDGGDAEDVVTNENEIISVSIDAGLSIRNLLPVGIEWEAGHGKPNTGSPSAIDGSSLRLQESAVESLALLSGECVEVYACNFKTETLQARFKIQNETSWSAWTLVSSPSTESIKDNEPASEKADPNMTTTAFQTNVHVEDDFGVPIVFGVRVVPKITKFDWERSSVVCYGIEVIIYAELWISNNTPLPLLFGCPTHQIHAEGNRDEDKADATKYSAEAVLMEIASVLELGQNGTEMDTRHASIASVAGEIFLMPRQVSAAITEEIFEYEELTTTSEVKRRWWASDNYWNLRNKGILELDDRGQSWHWTDPKWKIDTAGQASASSGGYESCEDLLGSGEGPFSGQRQFVPSHPFRRRRWFRARASIQPTRETLLDRPGSSRSAGNLLSGLQAFHQPIRDSFSREQKKRRRKKKRKKERNSNQADDSTNETNKIELDEANTYEVAVKCGDGRWSVPAAVSSIGKSQGSIQVFASRWPTLTNITASQPSTNTGSLNDALGSSDCDSATQYEYGKAPLNPTLFELVYQVSEIDGEWGEFSRHLVVSSRFFVRNDSKTTSFEIKQSGATEESAIRLSPGDTVPFFWSDFRLPRLVCVRPADEAADTSKVYKWSGGFDACKLGMTALLVRRQPTQHELSQRKIRSIRTLVELRPGTGGTGINMSFKEESEDGDGALYRIENRSTFNVWMAQDGVLANPSTTGPHDRTESDGDLIRPGERKSFGLDVPYRQGKYAGRQAATMAELLHVRVGLAPLSSRAGIETTKVIGLSTIGENIRLKPSKLVTILKPEQRRCLERVRVLGVTTADGPSRVLKFCMMATPSIENSLGSVLMDSVAFEPPVESLTMTGPHVHDIGHSASVAESLLAARELPTESEAKRRALFGGDDKTTESVLPFGSSDPEKKTLESTPRRPDTKFSVRASFSGFLLSLVDSSPSEICTISVSHMNAMAKWNQLRTSDASFLLSIGWLQVDNHIPSAPYPVAFCPALEARDEQKGQGGWQRSKETNEKHGTPLLFVGIELAPKHSSGVVCIKSATIAPRSLEISLDLAFLVRLQRFASCVQAHFEQQKVSAGVETQINVAARALQQRAVPPPNIGKTIQEVNSAVQTGVGRQQIYFGAFAVLNFTVFLSVAPARALTPAQAAIEGMEAAAIHKAVRKGDLDLGRTLGVVVGRRNKTAQEVAQGVFKSIVVDSLIRMDGASLNLAGAFLRNQIFYGSQLVTVIGAHYMYSMRQNVPALLGSMSAIGNPLGLFRGIGDGVHDFVNEPMKGIKKSIQQLDPQYMVDGVARGTGSLARHTVGGFADSAALLTSTFSKNMAVLTLDRRYAQKRDRGNQLRHDEQGDFFLLAGVESGFVKLAQGFIEGVTGVVRAPIRGAEKRGFEGFAKGIGKGLLGLLVKPMIGISDAATDVFLGVKTSVEGEGHHIVARPQQFRPRRALYGRDKHILVYDLADAAASALMLRTRIGGQNFLSHLDMDDRVALLSDKRLLLLDSDAKEQLLVKFKHISNVEVHEFEKGNWSILVMLNSPRRNGSEVEVITCKDRHEAEELCSKIKEGMAQLDLDVN